MLFIFPLPQKKTANDRSIPLHKIRRESPYLTITYVAPGVFYFFVSQQHQQQHLTTRTYVRHQQHQNPNNINNNNNNNTNNNNNNEFSFFPTRGDMDFSSFSSVSSSSSSNSQVVNPLRASSPLLFVPSPQHLTQSPAASGPGTSLTVILQRHCIIS